MEKKVFMSHEGKTEEVSTITISDNQFNKFTTLSDKYENYAFNTKEEEKEFLNEIKNFLDAEESDIEFEAKIYLVGGLLHNIRLKKFGILDSQRASK